MPLFLGDISPGATEAFVCLCFLSGIPPGRVGVLKVGGVRDLFAKIKKNEEKTRQLGTSSFLNAGTSVPPALVFAGVHGECGYPCLCPSRLALPSENCDCSRYIIHGFRSPHALPAVEITQSSIRRQVQSKGKKVLHAMRH